MISTRCFTFQLHHEPKSIFQARTCFFLRLQCKAVKLSVAAAEEKKTLTHLWLITWEMYFFFPDLFFFFLQILFRPLSFIGILFLFPSCFTQTCTIAALFQCTLCRRGLENSPILKSRGKSPALQFRFKQLLGRPHPQVCIAWEGMGSVGKVDYGRQANLNKHSSFSQKHSFYDSINREALQLRTPSIKCKVESMCKMFSLGLIVNSFNSKYVCLSAWCSMHQAVVTSNLNQIQWHPLPTTALSGKYIGQFTG